MRYAYESKANHRRRASNCLNSSQSDDSLLDSETLSLCSTYKETIEIGGRVYQQLALEQEITFTPADEVLR
jgi:hypothetical protein